MGLDFLSLINPVVLFLSILLVFSAALLIQRQSFKFQDEIRTLAYWVFFAMVALLGKLLSEFLFNVLPLSPNDNSLIIQILQVFGIAFVVITAVFLIKVSLLIGEVSDKFTRK